MQFSAILDSLVIVSDKTCKILGKFLARSFKIMHYSCRKMQDSWKKYQFLVRVLKEISGLMKFLQDMSGSWNISTFLKKHFFESDTFLSFVFSPTKMYQESNGHFRTKRLPSVQKTTRTILSKRTRLINFGKKFFHFVFLFRQIKPL